MSRFAAAPLLYRGSVLRLARLVRESGEGVTPTGVSPSAPRRVGLHETRRRGGVQQAVVVPACSHEAADGPGGYHLEVVAARAQLFESLLPKALLDHEASGLLLARVERGREMGGVGHREVDRFLQGEPMVDMA